MILVTGGAGFIGANFVLDWLARERRAGRQPRRADLRRQPARTWPRSRGDARHVFVHGDICDRAAASTACSPSTGRARSCTSPPRATSTARIHGPAAFMQHQRRRHVHACSRRRARTGRRCRRPRSRRSASCTSRPTRSTARSARRRRRSPKTTPTRRTARTRPARRRATTWCAPGTTPTACRR